jgi:hypothetical protein
MPTGSGNQDNRLSDIIGPEAGFVVRLFLNFILAGWLLYVNVQFYNISLKYFFPWGGNP